MKIVEYEERTDYKDGAYREMMERESIEKMIKDGRGKEVSLLCKERAISPETFGEAIADGIHLTVSPLKHDALISIYLYDDLVRKDRASSIIKRIERKKVGNTNKK